jgi:hypothetical protein
MLSHNFTEAKKDGDLTAIHVTDTHAIGASLLKTDDPCEPKFIEAVPAEDLNPGRLRVNTML